MKTTAHSAAYSPLFAANGGERSGLRADARVSGQALDNAFAYDWNNAADTAQPKSAETLRHRHQIQTRQTRARRVIHHRRAK